MEIQNKGTTAGYEWDVNPFDELYELWGKISEGANLGVPHIVGKVTLKSGKIGGLEMDVILHGDEEELSFRDGDDIYFMFPAKPEDGIEGIYLKLHKLLGDAQ